MPTEYAPLEASVSVADWREGEAILWAGTNLAQKAEPEIVEITRSITNDGGLTYETATRIGANLVSTNIYKSTVGHRQIKLTIKVKTGATGANIECENLTAALGTIDNQSSPELTYDDDGNLYQKWTVSLNASAVKTAKDNTKPLVFKIYNQLDSEKQITLQLSPQIDPDELQYGDIIYDDASIVHLGETPLTGPDAPVAVGVVAYKSEDASGELACQKGSVNGSGEEIIGKAIVVALRLCANNTTEYLTSGARTYQWSSVAGTHQNSKVPGTSTSLFPYCGSNQSQCEADFYGYEKTLQMVKKTSDCATHSHPAAEACYNYDQLRSGSVYSDYLIGSTGWFMPSIGQIFKITKGLAKGGNAEGGDKNITAYWGYEVNPSNTTGHSTYDNLKSIVERAGVTYIQGSWRCVSSVENSSNNAPYDYYWLNAGLCWTGQNSATTSYQVQAILCY